MKTLLTALSFLTILLGCSTSSKVNDSTAPKNLLGEKVKVYTTASNSNFRLAVTDNLEFKQTPQPLESEVSVFVNPQKQYQSFLGIGGAITDASAEVFAKLSADKQQEILEAYYDKDKGIGYTLARTNIHSCDFSSGSYTYVN